VEERRRSLWYTQEEVQAFDQWRRIGAPVVADLRSPGSWTSALPFWSGKPAVSLGERLAGHPHDLLSARAALRSPAPLDEDTLLRVSLAQASLGLSHSDRLLLKLKASRWMLATSWRAASGALGTPAPEEYRRMLVERRMKSTDINAALADLARIASKDGQEPRAKLFLALLGERKAPNLAALHAELAVDNPSRPEAFRVVDGRPVALRPRDLTWSLVAQVLKSEGVR